MRSRTSRSRETGAWTRIINWRKQRSAALLSEAYLRCREHYRQIITLREIAGLDYQELAAALDIDLGTVKSRLSGPAGTPKDIAGG